MAILPDSDMCVEANLNPRASLSGRLEFIDYAGHIKGSREVINYPAGSVLKNTIDAWILLESPEQSTPSIFVPQLRSTLTLPCCSHWTQQERACGANDATIEFLQRF